MTMSTLLFLISIALLSQLSITEVRAVAGDVGDACGTGDTCTDNHAYCNTDKKCVCNTGFGQKGEKCVRSAGQPCDAGMCLDNGVCDSNSKCICNTTRNFDAGQNADATCQCKSNYALKADGTCALKIGQTGCGSDDKKCVDTGKCNSDTCECADVNAVANSASTRCECKTDYALKADGTCALQIGKTGCGGDDTKCVDNGKCNTDTCGCDPAKNAEADSNGLACKCKTNYAFKADGITCALQIGKTDCGGDDTKCVHNGKCNTDTCECDAAKNTQADSTGLACECKSTHYQVGAKCLGKTGQACSTADDCVKGAGIVCAVASGASSKTCQCDTSNNFAAASSPATSCTCASNYNLRRDGTCGLIIGQACTKGGKPCIDKAVCDAKTSKCVCDEANRVKRAASSTANVCECVDDATAKADGSCGSKVGKPCTQKSATDVCVANAKCDAKTFNCMCDGGASSVMDDGKCKAAGGGGGAAGVVASLGLLTAGLLVTSRLI